MLHDNNVSYSLEQGKKYKKMEDRIQNMSSKEGFESLEEQYRLSAKEKAELASLQKQYEDKLREYNILVSDMSANMNRYIRQTDPNNPYLNKVIRFKTGEMMYVTNKGTAKYITSSMVQTMKIPNNKIVDINISWNRNYSVKGANIPTNPPLIVGNPVTSADQMLGNEGLNVFVDKYIPEGTSPTYTGCYNPSENNDNMTFIGETPPKQIVVLNGDFRQPPLGRNTFKYYRNNSTEVPNWVFNGGALVNRSTGWGFPIPYPKRNNQCVAIQKTSSIYTTLNFSAGVEYTLLFVACGRNCCDNTKPVTVANPIQIKLHSNQGAFLSTLSTVTPPINRWTNFSVKFTVPSTNTYRLVFEGTSTEDKASAILDVQIAIGKTTGTNFTFNDCMNAASKNGYKYFSLQNADSQTSKGYCAVSNSLPEITRYNKAQIPTKEIIMWSTNTTGIGNTAILTTTGSLQVLNASGASIYSTPATNAQPGNYLGCYKDSRSRKMTLHNNGSRTYNNDTCQDIAEQNKYAYYGLQNTSGTNSQCTLSNDLALATSGGIATNCTKNSTTGIWSGGAWSNAIYKTDGTGSNYYLLLSDNGLMTIHRGMNPQDNQGEIWKATTTTNQKEANPNMMDGKFGRNWLRSGEVLAAGDYISSTSGKIVLKMGDDGNLRLLTFELEDNCRPMKDGKMGGGVNANAVYDIGVQSIPSNMWKLGYVNDDSTLFLYQEDNRTYTNEYTTLNRLNTDGNNLSNSVLTNTTVDRCKTACNQKTDCAGFVFDTKTKTCYPKNKEMYPYGSSVSSNADTNIYVRNINPANVPRGVTSETARTNTVAFSKYVSGGNIDMGGSYGIANLIQKQKMQALEVDLYNLSSKINRYTNRFNTETERIANESSQNSRNMSRYVDTIEDANRQIQNMKDNNVENVLKDTDTVLLQRNYEYLGWSILATSVVLVSMNFIKT